MKSVRRPRRLALPLAAVALALTATGCAYLNDTQTHDFYQAADGVNINETGLGVRNAVLVVDESGSATLYATATNTTAEDGELTLTGSYEGAPIFEATVAVPAQGVTQIGAEGAQQVTASGLAAKPGSMVELTVTAEGQEDASSPMPVLDRSLEYYGGASDTGGASDAGGAASDAGGATDDGGASATAESDDEG